MSLLNPARLRSEVEAREARKIKVFEHILDLCYNKIMTTNQQSADCCCIFMCPSVVFGMPLYNLMDCIRFIMMKLVEKGFEVHLAIPNNIFISWKKESNPDYSRQMYLTEAPAIMNSFKSSSKSNNLALMPPGSSYPLTDQDFKKSLGLGYADSGENLPVSTCTASLTPRCYNTYSRLRDNKKYTSGSSGSNNINADSNYKLFSSRPTVKKEKNYRPIEDYRQTNIDSSNGGFASSLDDINLFHSKLDELLA